MRSSSFFPRIEGVEASSRRESAKRGAKSEGFRWRMWVQHEKHILYNVYIYRHTVDTTRQQHIANVRIFMLYVLSYIESCL